MGHERGVGIGQRAMRVGWRAGVAGIAVLATSSIAASALAPVAVDVGGANDYAGLRSVACPSARHCTALDYYGSAVTFDPLSPGQPPRTNVAISDVTGVACPSPSQCTAVSEASDMEVTFDPDAPGAPTPVALVPNFYFNGTDGLNAIACPSARQCTAVGADQEVTFDPQSPGAPIPVTVASGLVLAGIACPSQSQCTAVAEGREVTFDPRSPVSPTAVEIDPDDALVGLACPSISQCTAFNSGVVITFDPRSPGRQTRTTIEFGSGAELSGGACPSTSQCTIVDHHGSELTFDPRAPGRPKPDPLDALSSDLRAVACPSTTQCTAVGSTDEVTFTPATGAPSPAAAFSLPSAKTCASRRHFTVHVRRLPGITWVGAVISIGGKRLKTLGRAHVTAKVSLVGLPKGTFVLSITARTSAGQSVTGRRTYHTCVPARRSSQPKL